MTTFYLIADTLGLALTAAGFVGCVVFVGSYRPLNLRAHGPAGRHLLTMSWSLLTLFGLSLLFRVVSLPLWLSLTLSLAVVACVVFAVWQRVWLHRRVKRDTTGPVLAERDLP